MMDTYFRSCEMVSNCLKSVRGWSKTILYDAVLRHCVFSATLQTCLYRNARFIGVLVISVVTKQALTYDAILRQLLETHP